MPRYIDANDFMTTLKEFTPDRTVKIGAVTLALDAIPTADVVERKFLDEIYEAHEEIGFEQGYRDGYAQALVDAIELVGVNTWAGSRLTNLQNAQPKLINGGDDDE